MVIEDGLDGGEALQPHHFFAIKFAAGLLELDVTFVGDLAEFVIEGHGILLLK
jgi:hypothetical protein